MAQMYPCSLYCCLSGVQGTFDVCSLVNMYIPAHMML